MSRSDTVDVAVGTALPELEVEIDTVHVFMFSAATWNRHLIHYDNVQAQHEGHQAIVAQRGLLGNYFVRQVAAWLDERGELTSLNWKVVRSAVPGDRLTCSGIVSASDDGSTSVTLEMSNQDGDPIASGGATVRLN